VDFTTRAVVDVADVAAPSGMVWDVDGETLRLSI
jgi:hypothetical protein